MVKNVSDFTSVKEALGTEPLIDGVKVSRGVERAVMPDLTGLPMRKALSRMEGKGLIIKFSGNGKVVEQVPKPGAVIEKGDICYLKFQSVL
jgi:beta-lactam-binding protein with PASTA domain